MRGYGTLCVMAGANQEKPCMFGPLPEPWGGSWFPH